MRSGDRSPSDPGDGADSVANHINDGSNGAKLLDDIVAAFKRHLVLPPHAAEAEALWVMFTHTFDAWHYSPRLLVTSPTAVCGKTENMEILKRLSARGDLIDNASEAAVFGTIDDAGTNVPTLLLDECDTFFSDKPLLRGVLNGGHRRGHGVLRRVWDEGRKKWTNHKYSIWAPVAIAGIEKAGDRWVWPALRTRAIEVRMHRKRPDQEIEKLDPDHYPALRALNSRAAQWGSDHLAALRNAKPTMPTEMDNRDTDNWRPLLAIADAAGGHWPLTARRMALAMSGHRGAVVTTAALLTAIAAIFAERDAKALSSEELCEELGKRKERPWEDASALDQRRLAALLADFDIAPKNIRRGDEVVKGYRRAAFADMTKRYAA